MDRFKRIPVREQEPKVRATNFEEVCLGYNEEEAVAEASRCLNCPKPKCVGGCPVGINIPGFIAKVKERDFAAPSKSLSLTLSTFLALLLRLRKEILKVLQRKSLSIQHFLLFVVVYVHRKISVKVSAY